MTGDPLTTEGFLLVCRQCGLTSSDLKDMTVGMCLDYIEEYLDMHNPKREKKRVRKATQSDFDNF